MVEYFEKVKERRSVDGSQAPGQSKMMSRQGSGISGFQVSVSKVPGFEFGEGVNFEQDNLRDIDG